MRLKATAEARLIGIIEVEVKDILKKINKTRTLGVAAFLISLSYFLSRLLGLVRDRLLASNFGIGGQTDAYTAAFRIPDLLFTILVSGAFAVAFIPVFVGFLERDKEEEGWLVASKMLNLIGLATLGFGVIAFIFAGPLVKMIAPGFDQARHDLTVHLTRIMMITPFLFGISSVFGAVQQSFNRFVLFALSSVFYNLGIIFGILVLAKFIPIPIYGVAWGVVAGTAVQAIVQWFGVFGLGFKFSWNFQFRDKSVIRIIKLMIPRSLDLAIDQLNWIIETAIGSSLVTGSLTSYYYANNLKNVPLGIFGGAIATAAFPSLIRAAGSKDKSKLPSAIVKNSRLILFLVVPAAAIAIIMRGYIVRLLFGFGDQATSDALGWLAGSIIAQSLFFLIARVFYALEDTVTPLLTSLSSIVVNVLFSLYLSQKYGVSGLAMALSIAGVYELVLLLILLRRKIGSYGLKSISTMAVKTVLASLAMAVVMYWLISRYLPLYRTDVGFASLAPKFTLICLAGLSIYYICGQLLRIGETKVAANIIVRQTKKILRIG